MDLNLLLPVAVVLAIGWVLYTICRPRPLFIVRLRDGVPRAARGQVTRSFLRDVAEICARHGVRDAEIRGIASDRRINLVFSAGMAEPCRQQIRNLWGVAGWSAAGPSGPKRTA